MLRKYEPGDESQVLALNEACLAELGPMDVDKVRAFAQWAGFFEVVEVDDKIVGLVIGLTEEAPYDSPYFGWFAERHSSFAYIDRVAIDERQRGNGWGPAMYRAFEAWARDAGRPVLCAEVNTQPPNSRSLRFHDLFGFDMVAQFQPDETVDRRVGMMVKRLN